MYHKILIVDDVISQRYSLRNLFADHYQVFEAEDAHVALSICKNEKIDLLITDIKLPDLSGIELIKKVRSENKDIKFILITAYNIDNYISTLRQENLFVVIPKTSIVESNYMKGLVRKILSRNPFGLKYYFPDLKIVELKYFHLMQMYSRKALEPSEREKTLILNTYYFCKIFNSDENNHYKDKIAEILSFSETSKNAMQIIEELTTNALKYTPENKFIELGFGIIDDYMVVGVVDYSGTLDPRQVLLCLERQIVIDSKSGLPLGIKDTHGRGLFICRESSNHLIINIEQGKKTEIIAMQTPKSLQGSKSISIFLASE